MYRLLVVLLLLLLIVLVLVLLLLLLVLLQVLLLVVLLLLLLIVLVLVLLLLLLVLLQVLLLVVLLLLLLIVLVLLLLLLLLLLVTDYCYCTTTVAASAAATISASWSQWGKFATIWAHFVMFIGRIYHMDSTRHCSRGVVDLEPWFCTVTLAAKKYINNHLPSCSITFRSSIGFKVDFTNGWIRSNGLYSPRWAQQ